MKARIIGAALLVAVLRGRRDERDRRHQAVTAASITVWLQVDAQSGWPDVVAAANAAFQKQHPGVDVNVQYQNWGTHLGKFDATLAGGNAPDVIEMGNTEMTKYMAAGAFQDIYRRAKSTFDNSSNWLEGLAASGRYNGKLYGVPYYAGSRVVTYRTDLFREAGIRTAPKSLAQFTSDARKLNTKFGKKGFSPVYIAGTDWYFAMGFVYDYGGKIATQVSGKWKGALDSPSVDRRSDRVQELLQRRLACLARRLTKPPDPVQRLCGGLTPARWSGPAGSPAASATSTRASTAQFVMPSHDGRQADAGLPRRLRPGSAGRREQGPGRATGSPRSRARLPRRGSRPQGTSRTRPPSSTPQRSASGQPSAAGSSPLRRTGSTSRTGISSAPCWPRS